MLIFEVAARVEDLAKGNKLILKAKGSENSPPADI